MKRSESDNALNSNQYTPPPYLDEMLQNSQNSQSEGMQMIGFGATIGSAFGPIGTAVGGFVGGLLCIVICHDGNYRFLFIIKVKKKPTLYHYNIR